MNTKLLILTAFVALVSTVSTHADTYDFQGAQIDVEEWYGTGSNETILVVDWNRLDNGTSTVSESHAFGYRWDGTKYVLNMLNDFHSAGILNITLGYGGTFPMNITYTDPDDGETHMHIEEGSFNLASTSDPFAHWGTWGDSDWDFNTVSITEEPLADGQFEGINAVMYNAPLPAYANDQLDIPLVPEPASLSLLAAGGLGLIGRRKRSLSA